jgi:hypothetical protein
MCAEMKRSQYGSEYVAGRRPWRSYRQSRFSGLDAPRAIFRPTGVPRHYAAREGPLSWLISFSSVA